MKRLFECKLCHRLFSYNRLFRHSHFPWDLSGYSPTPPEVLLPELTEYNNSVDRMHRMQEEELDYLESNDVQYRGSR